MLLQEFCETLVLLTFNWRWNLGLPVGVHHTIALKQEDVRVGCRVDIASFGIARRAFPRSHVAAFERWDHSS